MNLQFWNAILETAIQAPSPHNVQPWRIKIISDSQAELFIDSNRTLPKEDVTGSFIILTMGLFLEAMSLVAANRGYKVSWVLQSELATLASEILKCSNNQLIRFARLELAPDSKATRLYDDDLFFKRRTSRISLHPNTIPDEATKALTDLAAKWNQRYEEITDQSAISRILASNTEALFEDLNAKDYHDEIVSWFRFTDRASQRTRDGLDFRCMNTSRSAFWLTARFPRLLVFWPARLLLARQYRAQLGNVPTIGLLAGDFWEPERALDTGRFLMQFWLEATKHSLYIHPYGNLVTNRKAASWCRQELAIEKIWLIFKIGFSPEPPKSYRRSVQEVLVA